MDEENLTIKENTDKSKKTKEKADPKVKKIRKNRRQRRLKDEIKHNLIPIHTIATEQDLAELSLKNITIDKLPLLSISDPAIRHLEVKPGDVIKIKRKNEIIGDIYYYRKVISDE